MRAFAGAQATSRARLGALLAAGAVLTGAGCGLLGGPLAPVRPPAANTGEQAPHADALDPTAVATALRQRLESDGLSVRAVGCTASDVVHDGVPSHLCTVNFGDPHLVPYCAALTRAGLVTDRDEPALTCYPPEEAERYRENAYGYRND